MTILRSEKTVQHYINKHHMESFLNESLLENLRLFEFPAFTHVYVENDEQHFLYFLVEGQVQCSHYHLDGTLAVIAVCNPFVAIGDIEILSDERLRSNVITTQKTTMLGISREVVQRYGQGDPLFLRFIIEELRRKLYETNHLQTTQVLPVTKRLAVYVLAKSTENESSPIVLPDKESLASMLGTTTRHLNRILKELTDSEIIGAAYPRLHILNQQALEDLTY